VGLGLFLRAVPEPGLLTAELFLIDKVLSTGIFLLMSKVL